MEGDAGDAGDSNADDAGDSNAGDAGDAGDSNAGDAGDSMPGYSEPSPLLKPISWETKPMLCLQITPK